MSIYAVHLYSWFYPVKGKYENPKEDKERYKDNVNNWSTVRLVAKYGKCCVCGKKKLNPRLIYGMHSIPWGYGSETLWCTKRCFNEKA